MPLPSCSVCGLLCGDYNTAVDELGNPVGEWVHIVCQGTHNPVTTEATTLGNSKHCRGYIGTGVFAKKKSSVHKLRVADGRVGPSVRKTLYRMQINHGQIRRPKGGIRF